MKKPVQSILDTNEAVTSVAYRLSETIAIYPITPSSSMGELSDEWAANNIPNIWGNVPHVVEMQSEGGAAGAVHGALQAGTMCSTFTASQGLLLMIPNMYKIAGELNAFCMHVTARSLATHALSIFGDHSDVMSCRQTGFALVASNSVQEAHDLACICHAATLKSRIPFLHFFDGFRTSHEVNCFDSLSKDDLRAMIDFKLIREHRGRAMSPDRPVLRGTAQNPDVFFQSREAVNRYYDACADIVEETMNRFKDVTGRTYRVFDYEGHPEAEKVIVIMGSAAETVEETTKWLNAHGAKTGILKVRLFRPFSVKHMAAALPATVKSIGVLDRTKEPGSIGEPLYMDIIGGLEEARLSGLLPSEYNPLVAGGRYGLGSKEFSPPMAKAVYDNMGCENPRKHFTIGINDDVSGLSLGYDDTFDVESKDVLRAVFFGLGADGTVGANKNTIKIIGEETENYAQAYFVYDSKKSGAMTVSHLRFGPDPIRAPYLIKNAQFVGCHQFSFLDKYDVLDYAAEGGVFLLNSIYVPEDLWFHIPDEVQQQIVDKKLRFYVIDAYKVARETGMGARINTIMQTCYFAISGILPREEAITKIKEAIYKTYGKKGDAIVQMNNAAVDASLDNLHEVTVPEIVPSSYERPPIVSENAPEFIKTITAEMLKYQGDRLPVSAMPVDGTWPTATTQWEKRNVAQEIPIWDPSVCIQCNKCAFVCPHAAIRAKFYPEEEVGGAPESFQFTKFRSRDFKNHLFTIQVAPEDCTGCQLCVEVCPAKNKANPRLKAINMKPQAPIRDREVKNYDFFLGIPNPDTSFLSNRVKDTQFRQPLFEYSGACPGCGETPYVKLLSQLFGDRLMISNATGCSSIYGGNLPTTPYCVNEDGRGPTWSNSLFEDNAEFGFGMRMAEDKKMQTAKEILLKLNGRIGNDLIQAIIDSVQNNDAEIAAQRRRVQELREILKNMDDDEANTLYDLAESLVDKSVWVLGGDGWAYDIGYGGLDHVIASGRNVNILVLDTEVYSNTGGQMSKATPLGAVAKFAASGKPTPKKDLGLLAISYGTVYVAQVAMGAKDSQVVQAFIEAEGYSGPSLIIAYSHCIAHGYNLNYGLLQHKLAVESGQWPLYRFDPRRTERGEPGMILDSAQPKRPLRDYMENEARFSMLYRSDPERAKKLERMAQLRVNQTFARYQQLAGKKPFANPHNGEPIKDD